MAAAPPCHEPPRRRVMTPITQSSPANGAANGARLDFRPLPLLSHPHVQTLLGHILPGPTVSLPTREQVIRLPDGDGLILYGNVPPGCREGGRVAVLIHGLTGSHDSPGIRRL